MSAHAGQVPLPEGTVTFLFSDVEGSTQLLERHGTAMGEALALHHAIFAEVVARHEGRIFETVGDAVYAAFALPSHALAAALDAQHALATQDWGPIGRLAVKIAVHTGEVERRGHHYFGPALFRAARLQALGHGEQTLVSGVTARLVESALPDGASLRDLGTHRLKDLGEPEHVFQLVEPGLRSDFPALKSLDSHHHNLPLQLSSFVGRERELAELRQALTDERLVTLVGPGGIGKTRLALQAAADQVERFRDGVFLVEFASLRDPDLVPGTIAITLGLREQAGQSIGATLAEHLRSRSVLLVLDNLEQLLPPAAPSVAQLLSSSPELQVLATSRAPLRVRGEREYTVPPLAVGRTDRLESEPPAAVALFVTRGRAIDPTVTVTDQNGPLIAAICGRLDGLPLAIELAAARLRVFNLDELHRRLTRRLPLLAGGPRDLPERQQTLHNAIAWSEELLVPEERNLFARLGVFVGGFTLDAAEVVAGSGLGTDVLAGFTTLLEGSLLGRVDAAGEEPRYGMLETIREYALWRLDERGELTATRRRHAAYFAALVSIEAPLLEGVRAVSAHGRLHSEWPNITTALAAYEEWTEWSPIARTVGQLARFWRWEGNMREGRRWLERVLEHKDELDAHLLADVYWSLSGAAYAQGDYDEAERCTRRELELAQELGDRRREARASLDLAGARMFAGRYDEVESLHRNAITVAEELGDLELRERARHNLGRFLGLHIGRDAEASALLTEVRDAAAARGDTVMVAFALVNMGEVANRHARYKDARPLLERGRALAAEIENRHLLAGAELDLGELEVAEGNTAAAIKWLSAALRSFLEMGEKAGVLECVEQLAFNASDRDDHARALRLLGAADRLRSTIPVGYRPRKDAMYDRVRRRAGALPSHVVDEEWSRGLEMAFDAVMGYALDSVHVD